MRDRAADAATTADDQRALAAEIEERPKLPGLVELRRRRLRSVRRAHNAKMAPTRILMRHVLVPRFSRRHRLPLSPRTQCVEGLDGGLADHFGAMRHIRRDDRRLTSPEHNELAIDRE